MEPPQTSPSPHSPQRSRLFPQLPQAIGSPDSCYIVRLASHLSTHYPIRTLLAVYIVPIFALVLVLARQVLTVANPTYTDYFLRDHIRTRLYDARAAAHFEYYVPSNSSSNLPLGQPRTRIYHDLSFLLLYRMPSKSDNILTPDHIAAMKRAEDIVFQDSNFSRMCFREINSQYPPTCNMPQCAMPLSAMSSSYLYGYTTTNQDVTYTCRRNNDQPVSLRSVSRFINSLNSSHYSAYVGRSATERNTTWIAASYMMVGMPFGNDRSENLDPSQMSDIYSKWIWSLMPAIVNSTQPYFSTYVFGTHLTRVRVSRAVLKDFLFAAVALVVVAMFIVAHTGSLFLGIVTVFQVFFSLPISLVIYRFIFGIPFFSVLHVFAIYLLVGIAADDVFVFTDAWKQSSVVLGSQSELYSRMVWSYRRAVAAMAVTTVTTAFAFVLLLTSPIMPIATLGAWACLIIIVQFLFVITAYPCAIILWQRHFRNRSYFTRCLPFQRHGTSSHLSDQFDTSTHSAFPSILELDTASTPVTSQNESNVPRISAFRRLWQILDVFSLGPGAANGGVGSENGGGPLSDPPVDQYRLVEQFFRDKWIAVLCKFRYALVIFSVAFLVVCISLACLLETPDDQENLLRPQHPNEVAERHVREELSSSLVTAHMEVRLTWGILNIDRKGTSYYNRDEIGLPVLDQSFDLKPAASQEFLLQICRNIAQNEELVTSEEPEDRRVRCWIEDFLKWRTSTNKVNFTDYKNDASLMFDLLNFGNFESLDDTASGEKPYVKYFEGKDILISKDFSRVVSTEIRFLSRQKWRGSREEIQADYKRWDHELNRIRERAPSSMENVFATAGVPWAFVITQETVLFSMRPGIAIMLVSTAIIMFVGTGSIAISILCTFAVGGIVGSMFGFLYVVGWDLGIAECLSAVISIGYAFDGVAHIGKAYGESDEGSREQRTRDALTALGISVLFGALSTAASALMLLFTQVVMLFKFGVLVAVTMTSTLLWGLVLLPAGLLVFGPCKKDLLLRRTFRTIWDSCLLQWRRKRRGNDVVDDTPKAEFSGRSGKTDAETYDKNAMEATTIPMDSAMEDSNEPSNRTADEISPVLV